MIQLELKPRKLYGADSYGTYFLKKVNHGLLIKLPSTNTEMLQVQQSGERGANENIKTERYSQKLRDNEKASWTWKQKRTSRPNQMTWLCQRLQVGGLESRKEH